MPNDPILLDVRDGVAYLTLNRPHAMNAIDESVLTAFPAAAARAAADPTVRALVIEGAGDAFCVGLDIDLLGRAFGDHTYFADVLRRYRDVLLAIEDLPIPVIAAVTGLARAGGFELILACDLVIVASEARIGDTHVAFGLLPGGGATARAPRRLGWQRAADLLLTGRWMTGTETVEMGLAMRAVPRAELPAAVEEVVARIRGLSRAAITATKGAMRAGADVPARAALDVEIDHFARYLATAPKADEGYRSFVEKRKPAWD